MNKLKTIGLSALAGSLAAFSAQAFEASVSGGAEITVTHLGSSDVTGNPLGARKNITISGSGELDNGWGISVFHALGDTGAFGSSVYSFDMGSIGTISLDSGSGGHGAAAIDNIVPTAYEEADYGFTTGANDIGGTASGEYIGYSNTVGAATILAAYNPDRGGGTQGDGGAADTRRPRDQERLSTGPEHTAQGPGHRLGAAYRARGTRVRAGAHASGWSGAHGWLRQSRGPG